MLAGMPAMRNRACSYFASLDPEAVAGFGTESERRTENSGFYIIKQKPGDVRLAAPAATPSGLLVLQRRTPRTSGYSKHGLDKPWVVHDLSRHFEIAPLWAVGRYFLPTTSASFFELSPPRNSSTSRESSAALGAFFSTSMASLLNAACKSPAIFSTLSWFWISAS